MSRHFELRKQARNSAAHVGHACGATLAQLPDQHVRTLEAVFHIAK